MCQIKRCRNTDIALTYYLEGVGYEICHRCWNKYGNLNKEELIKKMKGGANYGKMSKV